MRNRRGHGRVPQLGNAHGRGRPHRLPPRARPPGRRGVAAARSRTGAAPARPEGSDRGTDLAPDLARFAHHAEAAADAGAVLRLAPAAAERAARWAHTARRSTSTSVPCGFAALEPEARGDLLELFAAEAYVVDMREEAVDALDEALAIRRGTGDLIGQGELLVSKARTVACMEDRTAEADGLTEEAVRVLESVGPSGALARAYGLLAASRFENAGHGAEEAVRWGKQAIEIAERVAIRRPSSIPQHGRHRRDRPGGSGRGRASRAKHRAREGVRSPGRGGPRLPEPRRIPRRAPA